MTVLDAVKDRRAWCIEVAARYGDLGAGEHRKRSSDYNDRPNKP
jgi:hypothetical protein